MLTRLPTLPELPRYLRICLGLFLVLIGTGYLVALANIHFSHRLADGTSGLHPQALREVYHRTSTSIMMRMITTSMRQYFRSDDDYGTVVNWLESGATEDTYEAGGRESVERILIRSCSRCHSAGSGVAVAQSRPLDNYRKIEKLITPGPGQSVERLTLVTHLHMLSIPVLAMMSTMVFATSHYHSRFKSIICIGLFIALIIDFASWWLSRWSEHFIYGIIIGGVGFAACFGIQIAFSLLSLCIGRRRTDPKTNE